MAFSRQNGPRPTDGELEILTVLWSLGPSTVREVQEVLEKGRPTQYTTVLKQLQIMAEKGLVVRNEENRAHRYEASRPAEETRQQLAGDLMKRAFGGSAKQFLLGVLGAKKPTAREIAELKKLLENWPSGETK